MRDTITQVEFPYAGDRRTIRARFDAEPISSDGGLPLLDRLDRRLGLIAAFAMVVRDRRDPDRVDHSTEDQMHQRVYQIGAGYEDCNDAATLRRDPVFKTCVGRDPILGADLASQPTLSRLENSVGGKTCYLLSRELLESYFARHPKRPSRLILDLDTTEDPTHGQQELSFFHAFYDNHVYLPLLVFDQDGDLIAAVLMPGKPQGTAPVIAVLERIIERARQEWPDVPITVRGDAGFSSGPMYQMCQRLDVDPLLGITPNARLKKLAARLQRKARRRYLRTGRKARIFTSARYRARRGWPRSYRVLIKAEHDALGSNVRFVVTTLRGRPDRLYDHYVERAEACENSIKDLKNALHADRLSCHRFWANQFRLLLHAAAYVLFFTLRRLAAGTELAEAQMDTLRLRLIKIGVHVAGTARHIWFHLSSSHPWQKLWRLLARRVLAFAPD